MFSFYRPFHKNADGSKGQWAIGYQFKTRAEAQAKLDWIYSNTDWLLNGYIVKNLNEL